MYTSFFGLSEKPFAITPDPRYLYLSERHAEALAHLLYGINESGGFIQLTGEVGTGKTTIVRTLLSRIPQHADVAVILNPRVTPAEFLLTICEELGVDIPAAERDSVKTMVDALNRRLLAAHAAGRRVILIVDEAQNLSAEVLEQVRLLTNLETPTQKLLQIILIGQPELRELLDRNDLRQLAQRITGRYHLNPLTREETKGYVRHRMRVAGVSAEVFSPRALREIYRASSGVPRVINVVSDRALLGAYTQELRTVDGSLARRAAGEVYGRRFVPNWVPWACAGLLATASIGAAILAWRGWPVGVPRGGVTAQAEAPLSPPADTVQAPTLAAAPATVAPTDAAPTAPAPTDTAGAAIATVPAPAPAPPSPSPSADAAQPAQTFVALLDANAAETTEAAAFRRLFSLWGAALVADQNPCGQAPKVGLACLEQHGSWAQVRILNRPAVLALTDERGNKREVALTALDDDFATLSFGGHSERVPLDAVSPLWFGEFTVLWKPKTAKTRQLALGSKGADVRWLRRSLNALDKSPVDPAAGDVYDKTLAAAVEEFQRQHRLNVDGIAGIQTQVVLDAALAEPESPLLRRAAARGG